MSSSKDSPSTMDNGDNVKSFKSNIIYSKVSNSGVDKYIGLKITNLNDLKKATPRIKLPTILTPTIKKNLVVPDDVKQKLKKYCRACAGIKVPMIDIFSIKGNQMRLLQQIQHLEDIDKEDSLSTQMCMECICDMRASYKLFMQIKKAEMKLKSICDSLNKSSVKQAPAVSENDSTVESITKQTRNQTKEKVISNSKSSSYDREEAISTSDNENYQDEDIDTFNQQEETFEDFDSDQDLTSKHCSPNKNAYKFDESINAYVKVKVEEDQSKSSPKIQKTNDTVKKENVSSSLSSQSSKRPNILKRKPSVGNINEKNKKTDLHKLSQELRVKIPRLNMEEPMQVKTEEDGVMYVTAAGTKPNEKLLIKVKKMDKSAEKKPEKPSVRKKDSSFWKVESKYTIDEQIEMYKKKRVQVLGEIANVQEDVVEDPDIRAVDKSTNVEDSIDSENITMKVEDFSKDLSDGNTSEDTTQSQKLKQRWQDMRKRHIDINRDLAEDCTERLKLILRQKDEYIAEFVQYLKQRKIVASRLRDEDIIVLYEAKNNVVIERLPLVEGAEFPENVNSFDYFEGFDCDYCNRVFPSHELELEHEKIHEVKLMHYCEDCKRVFSTHKAKRGHNGTCIQKITCKYCNVVLESKGKKRQHEQKHCDEKFGQLCDRCGEKFKHQGTLDQHVKSKHMQLEKIFKCPQCPKRFALRPKLTFHLKSVHTTSRAFLCEDCGSDFKNPASLRHHRIRKHQSTNNKKECPECHKSIPVYSMSKHMHTHKSYSIQCQHCDKKFKNTSTLKQHLRIHEDQRQYKCDYCGVGFNRRDGLRLHIKVHEKGPSKTAKICSCQVCGLKFPNHSTLVIHRNRAHKDGRNYTCHLCNRSMISTSSLEWHYLNIHKKPMPGILKEESSVDVETKRVTCPHCEKTFKTEMILRTHVKNTHIEKAPVKCPDCDETYTSDVRLKHHMMTQHNRTEGTVICPHEGCGKRFVNQLRLKTHLVAHSEERPHACDLCENISFKTRIQLIKHKQNRHSNERPLQCRYCPHTCKQVSALVCHERTHTNERPYACSVCQQRFKYLGDKNKHERRHEVLGGKGFKRVVPSRDTNNLKKKKKSKKSNDGSSKPSSEQNSEHEPEVEMEQVEDYGAAAHGIDDMEHFEGMSIIKLEKPNSEATFEQVYVGGGTVTTNSGEIVGIDHATVYAEEVVTGQGEPQIITHDMIDESMLQPGTVVHIRQEDETGKIQLIPLLLSDLSDANADVNLETASIMYTTS